MVFNLRIKKASAILALLISTVFCCLIAPVNAQTVEGPKFKSFSLNDKGLAVINGEAAAFSAVELMDGARKLGDTKADDKGGFTIELQKRLGNGQYQFVLRATDPQGMSITSVQTANVSVAGPREQDVIALVKQPDGTRRFISGEPRIIKSDKAHDESFDVDRVIYQRDSLAIVGRGPAGMQVMASLGDMRIGTETIAADGSFLLLRILTLPAGDQVFRLDLINETGETVATLGVPFGLDDQKRMISQMYRDGRPVRTVFVQRGDTLTSIAQKVYGDSRYEQQIYLANRDTLRNKDHIVVGQEILLPSIEDIQPLR